MKFNELKVKSKKSKKRVGRGIAAGQGKTAGRGTKGQNARTGGGVRIGFEGGQNPLAKRLPKQRGFNRTSKDVKAEVKTQQLSAFKANSQIDAKKLKEANLVPNKATSVKLLYNGEVKASYKVVLSAASKQAIDSIEKAGGSFSKSENE